MNRTLVFTSGLLLLSLAILINVAPAQAQVTFIGTRTTFNLVAPGLPVEDFEEADVADEDVGVMDGPLDSATNNEFFQTGDILPGLSITSDQTEIAIIGANFASLVPSKSVFGNAFDSTLVASFTGGVNAVGLDLYAFDVDGDRTVRIFSSSGEIASTTLFTLTSGSFLGFTSTVPVTSVVVDGVSDANSGFDNIAFGNAELNDIAPEPGTLALLGAGLGVVGFLARRKR